VPCGLASRIVRSNEVQQGLDVSKFVDIFVDTAISRLPSRSLHQRVRRELGCRMWLDNNVFAIETECYKKDQRHQDFCHL
jgi:hypothetical protein